MPTMPFYVEQRKEKIKLWKEGKLSGLRGKTATARWLKDYILEKYNHKCSECGWAETNKHTGLVPLELEHKDGDFLRYNPSTLS